MLGKNIPLFLLGFFMLGGIGKAQNFEIASLGFYSYNDITNDQKLSDIWGYAANGKEYALVGLWDGFSVLDITNPLNIVEKTRVSGPSSVWRDIKTWDHYAYVSHDFVSASSIETAVGILIVDLNTIDSATVSYTTFNYSDSMNTVHNIYIDENGVLYAFGSDYNNGGALMFDLVENEMAPTYLGVYDSTYLHDGFVRGDTLWGGSINEGEFKVIDVSIKSNPLIIGAYNTPNNFTHNCWPSDDNKYLFTSDEVFNGSFAAYDISDLSNIEFKSSIQSSFSQLTVPHNTHFYDNFIVNSYYKDGLQIVDVSRPEKMVEVGRYDSSPNYAGFGFNGAWGAYPYLPSTRVLISDMEEGLSVVQPSYQRASFYEGVVVDITNNQALFGADVVLNGDTLATDFNGKFLFGQRELGLFDVTANFAGYTEYTAQINMVEGQTLLDTIFLEPIGFGLSELEKSIVLYPNPAKNELFVASTDIDFIGYAVYNIEGKLIYTDFTGLSNNKVDISMLSKGVYMLELESVEGVKVNKKFTKL